jgi:hypothetical protein
VGQADNRERDPAIHFDDPEDRLCLRIALRLLGGKWLSGPIVQGLPSQSWCTLGIDRL